MVFHDNVVYHRPVIPLLAGLVSGIVMGLKCPFYPVVFCSVAIGITCFIVLCVMRRKPLNYLPIGLFVVFGCLLVQINSADPKNPAHIRFYVNKEPFKITGKIQDRPKVKGRTTVFTLSAKRLRSKAGKQYDVYGSVRVAMYGANKHNLKKGDEVLVVGRIRSFKNFSNPGGFDYEHHMKLKHIWGSVYVPKGKLVNVERSSGDTMSGIRYGVDGLIDNALASAELSAVMKALITGNKDNISGDMRNRFNRTGTGHLLAISGLHIGIVSAVSFMLLCRIFSFSNVLLRHGAIKKTAGVFALLPVLFYGGLSGMSPSTQRAVLMVAVFLLAYSFESEPDSVNTLAIAAMVILVISPASLFYVSFQLSFAAVFFIIYGMSYSYGGGKNRSGIFVNVKNYFISYISASLLAFFGTLPLVAYYFNQVSLVGVFANFVLIPLVGLLVVPVGLFGVFISPASETIAGMCLKLSGAALELALSVITHMAGLKYAAVKIVTPTVFEIICYYGIVFILFALGGKREQKNRNALLKMKWAMGFVAVIVIFDVLYWVDRRFFQEHLKVTMLDVGQGSSALLELPGGKCMLIDGGGFSDNASFDMGEKIIAPVLWKKKIATVDTVVLSHPESDHLNGLLYILKHFNVKQVWSNGQKRDTKGYQRFNKIITEEKTDHVTGEGLSGDIVINGVTFNILWPDKKRTSALLLGNKGSANDNSIVIRAAYQSTSFLFPGDIMETAEQHLSELYGDALRSTVLMAPHHGSKTSSTQPFLDDVQPEVVMISAGWRNRFKMPHLSVLKRFETMGAKVFRTDVDGAIVATVDGEKLTVDTTLKK